MQPVEPKRYFYIDPRQHQDRQNYSDQEWKAFAEENGENYCLTEQEFKERNLEEYLEYMEYRYI